MSVIINRSAMLLTLCWALIVSGTHVLFVTGPIDESIVVGFTYEFSGLFNYIIPALIILSFSMFFLILLVKGRVSLLFLVLLLFFSLLFILGFKDYLSFYSGFREYVILLSIFFCVYIYGSCNDIYSAKNTLYFIVVFFTISSIISVFLLPSYGVSVGVHEGRWQGIFSHKNQLGAFCVLGIVVTLYDFMKNNNGFSIAVFSLLFLLVVKSESYLSIALSVYVVVYFLFYINKSLRSLAYLADIGSCLFVFIVFFVFSLVVFFDFDIVTVGKEGFNSRDLIWRFFFDASRDNLFLGRGLGQIQEWSRENATYMVEAMGTSYPVGSAHNGYIELLFSNGLLGILFAVFCLYKFISIPVFCYSDRFLKYSALVCFLILNVFESRLLGLNLPVIFMLLIYTFLMKVYNIKKGCT